MDMVKIIGKTIANIIAPAEMPHAIAGLYSCYIASLPRMTGLSGNLYSGKNIRFTSTIHSIDRIV